MDMRENIVRSEMSVLFEITPSTLGIHYDSSQPQGKREHYNYIFQKETLYFIQTIRLFIRNAGSIELHYQTQFHRFLYPVKLPIGISYGNKCKMSLVT